MQNSHSTISRWEKRRLEVWGEYVLLWAWTQEASLMRTQDFEEACLRPNAGPQPGLNMSHVSIRFLRLAVIEGLRD
jgi:hypothetical protein